MAKAVNGYRQMEAAGTGQGLQHSHADPSKATSRVSDVVSMVNCDGAMYFCIELRSLNDDMGDMCKNV